MTDVRHLEKPTQIPRSSRGTRRTLWWHRSHRYELRLHMGRKASSRTSCQFPWQVWVQLKYLCL